MILVLLLFLYIDLLIVECLIFSGYNFKSLTEIRPHLEPTASGVTWSWAKNTARKYNCYVTVGYPEKATSTSESASPEYYNSALTVSPDGKTVANYRKSFLYYTDDTWASEGTGFFSGKIENLGKVAMGICKLPILLIEP
jgi:protein N-terminal amidase